MVAKQQGCGAVDIDRFFTVNQLLSCSNKSGFGKRETQLDNSVLCAVQGKLSGQSAGLSRLHA
jgi:hypothetical protein